MELVYNFELQRLTFCLAGHLVFHFNKKCHFICIDILWYLEKYALLFQPYVGGKKMDP